MPLVDLPADAQLDAPTTGKLVDLPANAQLDTPQIGGWGRLPAMAASNLAKGALEGVGAIGDLQGLMQRGVNAAVDPLLSRLFGQQPPPQRPPLLGSGNLVGLGDQAGITNRPDLVPQNTGERYLAAGAEGAGGMLPYLPLAGGSAVANAARGLTQGAAAGLGGETGAEMFPSHPELARAAGGILGTMGAGTAMNAGSRIASAAQGNVSPTVQAYRNLGVEPTLAGDVTGSPFLQQVQAFAGKSLGGSGKVQAASERAINQWGNALEDTASTLGNANTLQGAGEALQRQSQNWLNQFKADSRNAWANVDLHMPQNTPVPVTNYATVLNEVRAQMPNAPATAEALQPALTRNLLDSLVSDVQKGPLTWQDVKGIRTRIGEKLAEPQLVGDTGYTDLKRLYGALSDDLGSAIAARGPAAQAAFDNATSLTRDGHGFIENTLSNVLKGDKITPEQAASRALNSSGSGGTFLQSIRQEMPQAADELAAFKLRDMSLANAGQQNASATRLSPGTFLTDRAKLSPEAQSALFADPYVARRLDDLSTVAGAMKNTERFLNTSNTGSHLATGQLMASLGGAVPATLAGYSAAGLPGAAGALFSSGVAPFIPSYLASRLTTSPYLTGLLAAPAAIPQSAGLLSRAAVYPQIRGLLAGP